MVAVAQDIDCLNEKIALEKLLSQLDKGLNDVEAGRVYTVEETLSIIKERMEYEL